MSRVTFAGLARRIERLRLVPDGLKAIADLRLAQVLEIDAEALAVRKLGVVFSLPGEVGIDLDAMTDIADKDKRRPAVRGWQRAGVFFGLPLGVEHQHVPGAVCAALAAFLRSSISARK